MRRQREKRLDVEWNRTVIQKPLRYYVAEYPSPALRFLEAVEGDDIIYKTLHSKHEWICINAAITFHYLFIMLL
jgi:hypothetical protein